MYTNPTTREILKTKRKKIKTKTDVKNFLKSMQMNEKFSPVMGPLNFRFEFHKRNREGCHAMRRLPYYAKAAEQFQPDG